MGRWGPLFCLVLGFGGLVEVLVFGGREGGREGDERMKGERGRGGGWKVGRKRVYG